MSNADMWRAPQAGVEADMWACVGLPEQAAFPGSAALTAAAAAYRAACSGASYCEDLVCAHRAAGLVLEHAAGGQRRVSYYNLKHTEV